MQKLGTEEKEELKKAVEEAGLLAKEENNSQENNSQENCNQIKNRMQSHENNEVVVKLRHFPLSEEDSFVQFSAQMSEPKYNELINEK